MLDGFIGALSYFTVPSFLIWVFAGVIVGLIVGLLPGINGITALAIFLPFCFVLRPEQALPFMIAVLSTNLTGGVMTAVLMGIPGENSNIASCLDGYPMTQRGEAGRALGIALISSALGGSFAGFMALVAIPIVLFVVMLLGSPEMVFVILLGILCIGSLNPSAIVKGLISGGLGLIISLIGNVPTTGESRFTFDSIYLYSGLPLLPVILGLFAMPVMVDLIIHGGAIAKTPAVAGGWRSLAQAVRDILHSKWTFIRGTLLGWFVGIVPGVGPVTATWLSYAQAKVTSKNPEQFGKGSPEGLVASTCAVNASEAGDLLTTLGLGIPGSASMALVMGAMMVLGIVPGPKVLVEHLSLSLSLIYVVVVGHILGAVICLLFVSQLARVANVPARILVALIIPLVLVGVFAPSGQILDLVTLIIFTIIGVAMEEFGYSRPSLALGYILGTIFEHYLSLSYQSFGTLFFVRPVSMVLVIIIFAILAYSPLKALFIHWKHKSNE